MSDDNKVQAELRENFGKGYARRLRAAGKIPAVIYGHGTEPKHVALPGHQVSLLIRRANALLELDVAGTPELALVKDVQKDPVHQIIEHIDLLVVKKGEKIQVDIPVSLIGEPVPGTIAAQDANTVLLEVEATHIPERIEVDVEGESFAGTIADLDAKTLLLEVEATHIPESVVVSVEGLEEGSQIHAKDVELPKGSTLISDDDVLVVNVHVPQKVDLGEEAAEAAAAEAAAEAPAEAPSEESAE